MNALEAHNLYLDYEEKIQALLKAANQLNKPTDFGDTYPSNVLYRIAKEYEVIQKEMKKKLESTEIK
jgi:hypothetical protein